jgi:tRNA wybutosine-synthesizing protein 2
MAPRHNIFLLFFFKDVELWSVVGQCLNGSEVAKKDVISKDGFRTPQVTLLYGENPWVECVENGIK